MSLSNTEISFADNTGLLPFEFLDQEITYPNGFEEIMDKIDLEDIEIEEQNNINNIFPPYKMQRTCRSIEIEILDYNKLIVERNDGCALIAAPGGGFVKWYLCCRREKYYFIHESHHNNSLNGHSTTIELINDLINR
jgi:hypothetical protein